MNIKDYIHYYLGQWYLTPNSQGQINTYTLHDIIDMIDRGKEVKPILRRMESLTAAENKQLGKIVFNMYTGEACYSGQQFHYLLSLGIDLFGLLDAGLAVDAETIKSGSNA